MNQPPTDPPSRAYEQAEEALLEFPRPHGGGLPPALLANRAFVWLTASSGVSQLAFWAFFLAVLGEASYRFHAGSFQLAILNAAFSFSFIPLTVPFGMLVDRWSPKWVTMVATLLALASIGVAIAAPSIGWLYLAFVLDGVSAAFQIPARGSLTALLVEEAQLVRANGMLNAASMLAVILGPLLAGLLEGSGGFQPAIYVYALALGAVGGLLLLPVPDARPGEGPAAPAFVRELAEGFSVSWRRPELRRLLLLAGAVWFLTMTLVVLEPLFVKNVLHRGVDVLGFLWATHGVGALVGAVVVARWKRAAGREVLLIGASLVIAGVGFLVYVGTPVLAVAVAGTVILGVGFSWYLSLSQALIQRVSEENVVGRVTGVVGMVQEGAGLLCALVLAALGGLVGAVQPYLVGSAAVLVVAGVWGVAAGRRASP